MMSALPFAAGGFLLCIVVSKLGLLPLTTLTTYGEKKMTTAVLFGDSITQEAYEPSRMGWVSSLSAFWVRRIEVLNRGFGGYNSRWGLKILNGAVVAARPDIVIIFFGANDAVDPQVPQSVPLEEYTSNLREMILRVRRELPATTIILMTPPPVYEPVLEENNKLKGKGVLRDRTVERTGKYANAVIALGEELRVGVVDNFYSMDPTKPSREEYFRDGLHLSAKGNQKVFSNLVALIEGELPSLDPSLEERNAMTWPHWSKVVQNPSII